MEIKIVATKMANRHKKELEKYIWDYLVAQTFMFEMGLDDLRNAPIAIRRVVGKYRRDQLKKKVVEEQPK